MYTELLSGNTSVKVPGDTKFSYLEPIMAVMRQALESGLSLTVIMTYAKGGRIEYEVATHRIAKEDLRERFRMIESAHDFVLARSLPILRLGNDPGVRKEMLSTLDAGYIVYFAPEDEHRYTLCHYNHDTTE